VNPRLRRLAADLGHMRALAQEGVVSFRTEGDPPDTYHLLIAEPGLARAASGAITVRGIHRCTAYLHLDYPRRPPVLVWATPIVHPNILPPERNGGVCIGTWSAGESLADLIRRVTELVSYRAFNVDDALDVEAADWVRSRSVAPGPDALSALAAAEG
jgi:ubiquitin-protein ligase